MKHGTQGTKDARSTTEAGDRHDAGVRRAARTRLERMDRPASGSAMVGTKRIYDHDSRNGRHTWRRLAAHHARA